MRNYKNDFQEEDQRIGGRFSESNILAISQKFLKKNGAAIDEFEYFINVLSIGGKCNVDRKFNVDIASQDRDYVPMIRFLGL